MAGDTLSLVIRDLDLQADACERIALEGSDFQLLACAGPALILVEHGIMAFASEAQRTGAGTPAVVRPGELLMVLGGGELRIRAESGECATVLYGQFGSGTAARGKFFDDFPRHVLLVSDTGHPWLTASRDLLALEIDRPAPGSSVMVSRILDLLLIQALRIWSATRHDTASILRAAMHPRIGPILNAIHRNPFHPWSVPRLASLANISRSQFSLVFQDVSGLSPGEYVSRVKFNAITELLRTSDSTASEIAAAAGYASLASFTHAFTQRYGTSPGRWRTSARQGTVVPLSGKAAHVRS